jgi:hypothetical protein
MIEGFGLVTYKTNAKNIKVFSSPITQNCQQSESTLYISNNYLKKVILKKDEYSLTDIKFYIADEAKFIKLGSVQTEEDGSKFISISKE